MRRFLCCLCRRSATIGLDWIDNKTNLTFCGDLRLRYDLDWDLQTRAGVAREDRIRGRLRARSTISYCNWPVYRLACSFVP